MNHSQEKSIRKASPRAALPEQLVMLLVFSLCAAICLRIFVYANSLSRENARLDSALLQMENMAEHLKARSGNLDAILTQYPTDAVTMAEDGFSVCLNDDAVPCTPESATMLLTVFLEKTAPALGQAQLRVTSLPDHTELLSFPVSWQTSIEEANGNA